ncbi:MAG: ABC-type Fe3+ transport system protein [Labilithrix sp.]|nr:ABC-type Fe3+ transport system protein [Labilithrix sp.]
MNALTASLGTATLALLALAACDDRQVWHAPDFTLARMLEQPKADPYEATSAFADGKTMRDPPPGTVPHDGLDDRPAPVVTRASLSAGRTRYERTCAVCHGILGDGVSVVATKMRGRPPPTLLNPRSREHMYATVTKGYGLMPSYAGMLTADERWAVAAYVQALTLSQRVSVASLPPDVRDAFAREAGAR